MEIPSLAKLTHRTLAEWAENTVDSPLLHATIDTVNNLNTLSYTLGIQSRTVLSRDAEANRWPDGENETQSTASWISMWQQYTHQVTLIFTLWPTNLYALACGLKCHTIKQESIEPVAVEDKISHSLWHGPVWAIYHKKLMSTHTKLFHVRVERDTSDSISVALEVTF